MGVFMFLSLIVIVFFAILLIEYFANDKETLFSKSGLLGWLVSGNWPAKVGGGLLIFGVGALLRYCLINLALPDELKLGSGFFLSACFAAAAFVLRRRKGRRAIYLALAGASAGTAYLAAYSAYGFFHFISDGQTLALLVLVAVVTGVFALGANAVSIAVLAMIGAYIAPAFALEAPGPLPVYGYYVAVSTMCLLMVSLRGWRPLIHLSFLFTLAGSIFFAWTAEFYRPEFYLVMQPLLLALAMIHLIMPLVERKRKFSRWMQRFDVGYFLALPVVSGGLILLISPATKEGAIGLLLLGVVWLVTSAGLFLLRREEALRHLFVAALFAAAAVVCYTQDIPWILIGLCLSVSLFVLANRLGFSAVAETALGGVVLLFGFLHVAASIMEVPPEAVFINDVFAVRISASLLLAGAAWTARERKLPVAAMLAVFAGCWAGLSIIIELARLQIDFMPELVYGLLLIATLMTAVFGRSRSVPSLVVTILVLSLCVCGWWTAYATVSLVVVVALLVTPGVLFILAISRTNEKSPNDLGSVTALGLTPVVLLPWALVAIDMSGQQSIFLGAVILIVATFVAMSVAHQWMPRSVTLHDTLFPLYFIVIAVALAAVCSLHIERGLWPISFELVSLGFLVSFTALRIMTTQDNFKAYVFVTITCLVLVSQAMLLRGLGPDGTMTLLALNSIQLPAVLSLLWAIVGAGICWWSIKEQSRPIWSVGTVLLVVAAIKLVWLDFGSLGQLGNILALIAAGLVFLGVAWIAPLPPKRISPPPARPVPQRKPPSAVQSTAAATPRPANSPAQGCGAVSQSVSSRPARAVTGHSHDDNSDGSQKYILPGLLFVAFVYAAFVGWQYFQARVQKIQRSQQRPVMQERAPQRDVIKKTLSKAGVSLPMKDSVPSTPVKVIDMCTVFLAQLPENFILDAGGAYRSTSNRVWTDASGNEVALFDVYVNHPGRHVVLALGAYEASAWNIRASALTTIAGVFLSGYHSQELIDLDSTVPVLHSSYKNPAPCGYFYLDRNNINSSDSTLRNLFGRSADTYFAASDGRIIFGELDHNSRQDNPSFAKEGAIKEVQSGEDGLNQLLRDGKLRLATSADITLWKMNYKKGSNRGAMPGMSVYVITGKIAIPKGLNGAHAVSFIVPKGAPFPAGDPGHSVILDMNTMRCIGLACGAE